MPEEPADSKPASPVRRLYDWVLSWADSPFALTALVVIALAESSFFPVPPDILLIPMAMGAPKRGPLFALWCSVASITGGVVGYAIGIGLMEAIGCGLVDFYHGQATFDWVATKFATYNFWAVFVAAVTPIPYKIFAITAGAVGADFGTFFLASMLGRPIRFFTVVMLIFWFGPSVRRFIDRYLNLLSVGFVVLLIAGFGLLSLRDRGHREEIVATDSPYARICTVVAEP